MKPKIADIEGCHRILSEGDDPSTTILITMTECAALLRIARAAKVYLSEYLHDRKCPLVGLRGHRRDCERCEIHAALDAFDWSDE